MLRDLLSLAGGQLASRLIGFVAFAYLARVLAPAGYGAVEFAVGLAAVFASVIEGGSSAIGVRRLVRDPAGTARIAGEVLGTQTAVALASSVLMAGAGWLVLRDAQARALTVLFAGSLLAVPWAQTWLFQGTEQGVGASAATRALRMALFAVGVMLVVRDPHQAARVGAVEIAAVVLSGLLALTLQARWIAPVRVDLRPRVIRELIRESLPVSAGNVISGIELYAQPLLVAALAGFATAGRFSAAHRLSVSLATLSFVYHFNLYPVVSRLATRAPERLESLLAASFRVTAWVGFGAAGVLTLAAAPLLAATFGAPFVVAAPTFAVLVWTLPATLLADHGRWALIAHGEERAIPRAHLPGIAITLGLGALLVPRFGPLGGGVAMLASTLWVWGEMHRRGRRRLGFMPLAPAVRPFALTMLALTGAALASLTPLVEAALATAGLALLAPVVDRRLLGAFRQLAQARAGAPSAGTQQR